MTEYITRQFATSAVIQAASVCVTKFQANPYRYLYEADLQAEMFLELRARLEGSFRLSAGTLGEAELSYVYLEYPKYRQERARLDIAVLDPSTAPISVIESKESPAHFLYNLPVWVGIEIKYHKVGDLWGIEEVIRDLDNIHENLNLWPNRAAQKGLAVVFIQQDAAQKRFCGAVALEPASVIDSLDAIYVVSRHELWKIASRSDSKTR